MSKSISQKMLFVQWRSFAILEQTCFSNTSCYIHTLTFIKAIVVPKRKEVMKYECRMAILDLKYYC